jgi:hypothetical protein
MIARERCWELEIGDIIKKAADAWVSVAADVFVATIKVYLQVEQFALFRGEFGQSGLPSFQR